MSIESAAPSRRPAYARFTRRVQAVMIDSIVLMLTLAGALIIAVTLDSNHIARILGITVAIAWLLYEPLLVSVTGSTIGHYACNLRVVDNRTGGNIGFGKSLLRTIIKTILGWWSFITMTVASRHQAAHDLMTGSTVQIRNMSKAKPYHFSLERESTTAWGTPSSVRRLGMIVVYVVAWSFFMFVLLGTLTSVGVLPAQCVSHNICSYIENLSQAAGGLIWLSGIAWLLGLGWRGHLWGARTRRSGV